MINFSNQVEAEQGGGGGRVGAYSENAKVRKSKTSTQCEEDLKHQFLHLPCRLLLTSSKAVRKLLRRNELHGWNQRALDQEAHDQRVVANIRCVQLYILPAPRSVKVFLHNFPQLILCRKKWGIAPALTVEFVAYYHDRWELLF